MVFGLFLLSTRGGELVEQPISVFPDLLNERIEFLDPSISLSQLLAPLGIVMLFTCRPGCARHC